MPTDRARPSVEERVSMHRLFWERGPQPWPVASFRIAPDFFFSRQYRAAEPLLKPGKVITPDMLRVDDFLPDYERFYEESEAVGQDGFWTAEPYAGIPWMEAMLGCGVVAAGESFISRPWMRSLDELPALSVKPDNPWLLKYLEFTEKLVALSGGRFTVGMPIFRGPSDIAGAVMGQTEMVMALEDEPERMREMFLRAAGAVSRVLAEQERLVPPFHGGTAMGFYHVFCPGKSRWYQEDLSALMSPGLYRKFLVEPERLICAGCDQTAIHLHPSSFFLLDDILENGWLKAVEVNKDVGGPSVAGMLPQLRKISERKCLILWGDLTLDDLAAVKDGIPARGLFFNIIARDPEEAGALLAFIRKWRT